MPTIAREAKVSQSLVRDHLSAIPVASKVAKSREALACGLQDGLKGALRDTIDCLQDLMRDTQEPGARLKACEMILQISKEMTVDPAGAIKMTMKVSRKMQGPPPESLTDAERAEMIRRTAYEDPA